MEAKSLNPHNVHRSATSLRPSPLRPVPGFPEDKTHPYSVASHFRKFLKGFLIGLFAILFAALTESLTTSKAFTDSLLFDPSAPMYFVYLIPFLTGYVFLVRFQKNTAIQNSQLQFDPVGTSTQIISVNAEPETTLPNTLVERERHQHFIDLLPLGGIFVDDNHLTLNPKAELILGYQKSEITTITDWFNTFYPEEAEFQKRDYKEDRLKGFPSSILTSVQNKKGQTLYLEISRHIDENGEVWLLNDVTSQLEIKNERNIKNEILEKTSDEILVLDQSLVILSQNKASEKKVGLLIKSPFTKTLPEVKRAPFEKQVFKELKEHHFWQGQIQLLDAAGDEYPALLRLFAHYDPILKRPFYSALITDLSEIEMERYKSIQTSKLASIGELAAGVGHEINNPLAILTVNYEQCLRLVDQQAPYEKIKQQLSKHDSSIARITKIVDALRIYARGDKLQFEPISVHQGVRDTLNLIETMFNRYGIEIVSELKAEDDVILGNLGQIQQVLMNLLTNARDALENRPNKKIIITTRNEGPSFYLSITDNGQGMDEKTKQKIFEPFFTTKPRGKGTGMGTSISLGIIRNHHGQFDFSSKLNEGTTFWFKICTAKCANSSQNSGTAEDLKNLNSPKKTRILVVDDEPEIRDVLRFVLEKAGLEVHEAADGLEGIKLIEHSKTQQIKFDLIICDIQMPNLDGIGMYKELRADPSFNSKFILITGGIQSNRSTKGQQEILDSVDGFLRKPFSDEELLDALRHLKLLNP